MRREPLVVRHRIDVRPPFWRRLREVFWRGPPRPLRIGFLFGSAGPGGQAELRHVSVSVIAPCGVREVDLEFEVHVGDLPVTFGPSVPAPAERGTGEPDRA